MTEDMRLKEVVGQAMVVPGQKLHFHNRLKDETNSNEISSHQVDDNLTNRYCYQWSNANDYGDEKGFLNSTGNFNNNISIDKEDQENNSRLVSYSPSISSHEDSYGDYEGQSSSSLDVSPQGDEYHCFSQEDVTDSDFSDDGNRFNKGITNPNYPGFQDFANDLEGEDSSDDESGSNLNNNNNNNSEEISESVNHLDSVENFQKAFYDKPKFACEDFAFEPENLNIKCEKCENKIPGVENNEPIGDSGVSSGVTTDNEFELAESSCHWFIQEDVVATALFPVSGVFETTVLPDDDSDLTPSPIDDKSIQDLKIDEDSGEKEEIPQDKGKMAFEEENRFRSENKNNSGENIFGMPYSDHLKNDNRRKMENLFEDSNKLEEESSRKYYKETENEKKVEDFEMVKKKEKTQMNFCTKKNFKLRGDGSEVVRHRGYKDKHKANMNNRKSLPLAKEKISSSELGCFDVYNIETAMPKIDLDVIESHLKAAREEERRRRNDREEIRRRLAMGSDGDDYYGGERAGRKPSLQARLQSGMNLQICFMNETMSDNESPNSDSESNSTSGATVDDKNVAKRPDSLAVNKCHFDSTNHIRPSTSLLTLPLKKEFDFQKRPLTEADFFACQAQLQAEARQALSQAKEMARMQMEVERQRLQTSPITEMVRYSLEKVGIPFPQDRRRLSRQILTEMNVAQLQVIVNDLHTQIETLNESLVKFLIDRDDLHMEQDSMLVDIEDLTRYLGGKGKEKPQEVPNVNLVHLNNNINQNQNQNRISISSNATNE